MWKALQILGMSFLHFGVAGLCIYGGMRSLDSMIFGNKEGDK